MRLEQRQPTAWTWRCWLAGVAIWASAVGGAWAQNGVSTKSDAPGGLLPRLMSSGTSDPKPVAMPDMPTDPGSSVVQTGCSTCSGGLIGGASASPYGSYGGGCCGDGGCGTNCWPGRKPCDCCCDSESGCGKFFCGIYQCICCPDPCYEPHWVALADSAFFQDAARPITQMRFRYDEVRDFSFPDKAEYLVARTGGGGKGPGTAARKADYRDFLMYTETAVDKFSASIEIPYRQIDADPEFSKSGFADMTVGTKTLLLDCELIQCSFGLKTYIPIGNFTKGLGTGHVSMEPELLTSIKISPRMYFQGELAYWFPIGGDSEFEGPVFHYHGALNYLLWNCGHDVQLIGSLELNGYEFMGGQFTDPVLGLQSVKLGDVGNVLSVGPGIRLVICDKVDFGIGSAFAVTNSDVGKEIIRTEFRYRF